MVAQALTDMATVGEAFELLLSYSRGRNQKLTEVAETVVCNNPAIADLRTHAGGTSS